MPFLCCGRLNVNETAVFETWTDREIQHGPAACFGYNPCTSSVRVLPMVELKIFECAVVENTRYPDRSRYIYGPILFRYDDPFEQLQPIKKVPILDQNDYLIVTERDGKKRIEVGPLVYQPVYGESYSEILEAINVNVNEYVVLLDKSNNDSPLRHVRGPAKIYPRPYEEVVPNELKQRIRKCVEVTQDQAIWVIRSTGDVVLITEPQFYMPQVGEVVQKNITKTQLKEAEFCLIIEPSGQNVLKMGNNKDERAFFLPPFHKFLQFKMKDTSLDIFNTLPQFIPIQFTLRTADNVQIAVDVRVSFQIYKPDLYTKKPIDFYTQITYWVQNDLLDACAQLTFRDFLKNYAKSARESADNSHKVFNEYGIQLTDVQLIQFKCLDAQTQKLLDQDIITRVSKQNELLAKEADVEIMKRQKDIQLEKLDIEYETSQRTNAILLKQKELDVSLRMKEVELQIQEEKKRTELMTIKKANVVQEGAFEGEAQGKAVAHFLQSLPESLTAEQKIKFWETLRDLDKNAMVFSKISSIEMYPPGADVKKFEINVDKAAKAAMDKNPFFLPSILGYAGDEGKTAGPFGTQLSPMGIPTAPK